MYEAPDRYKRLISARLPGGESAGLAASRSDDESSPLRDVQLISRAQLAPFFAAVNVVAALMMVANLWGPVSPTLLLPWVAAVAAVNFAAMQLARTQSISCVGRSGRRVPKSQRDVRSCAGCPPTGRQREEEDQIQPDQPEYLARTQHAPEASAAP